MPAANTVQLRGQPVHRRAERKAPADTRRYAFFVGRPARRPPRTL